MIQKKNNYSVEFKSKVVLDLPNDLKTLSTLAENIRIHSNKELLRATRLQSILFGRWALSVKVVVFGEMLLRLASPGYQRLFQSNYLETSFCGAEANVAVSLVNYGIQSAFVSRIPDNSVGQVAINTLRYFGVNIQGVVPGGERLGLYYLEKGASQRPSMVLYDRAHSAIATACKSDFDWDNIFIGADWFHFTGINPALNDSLAEICIEACSVAKERNITISCDLNYRSKLWSSEKAKSVMSQLMEYVDVCIVNEEDAEKVLGIKASDTDVHSGKISYDGYREVVRQISDCYSTKYVAVTLRTSLSASDNKWAGLLYSASQDKTFFSKEYTIHIVDRIGSGDSFAAGLIYGLLNRKNYQYCIEFATAASCLKHSLEGDFNRVSVKEVEALLLGDSTGRVKR